jgi:hypothetical protein
MAILRIISSAMLATGLMAGSAYAQDDSKPPSFVPPNSGLPAARAAPASTTPSNASTAPGVYYGDHSGAMVAANSHDDATYSCDDATVNKPRVHGNVTTGVVAGNHISGNYQAATVRITKPLGDCEHRTGTLTITAHASQGHFGYRGSH